MYARLSALVIAIGAVVAINGCDDPTSIDANFTNIDTTVTLYAFNGTPATLPSALIVIGAAPVRIDSRLRFDLAFDINSSGQVVAYTVRKLASEVAGTHRVGLQFTDDPFALVTEAPKVNYVYDSTYVLPVGKVFLIDVLESSCSQFSILGPNIRAKAVVESVDHTLRAISLHILSNPNCGFVTLTPGRPPR